MESSIAFNCFRYTSGDGKEKRLTGSKSSRSGKDRSNRSRSRERKEKEKGENDELPFDHTKLDKVVDSTAIL